MHGSEQLQITETMSDAEIEQKREEDERLDTAEDPTEEVRLTPFLAWQARKYHRK